MEENALNGALELSVRIEFVIYDTISKSGLPMLTFPPRSGVFQLRLRC